MEMIIKEITTRITPLKVSPGVTLEGKMGEEYICYFFTGGLGVVYVDRTAEPLYTIREPVLVGLSQLLSHEGEINVKVMHSSNVYKVPEGILLEIINRNSDWEKLAIHLSKIFTLINRQREKKRKEKTRNLIISTLEMLNNESDEVRLAHTVSCYLRNLTGLSKSTIARELESLKKQGCIDIRNGVLLRFTR